MCTRMLSVQMLVHVWRLWDQWLCHAGLRLWSRLQARVRAAQQRELRWEPPGALVIAADPRHLTCWGRAMDTGKNTVVRSYHTWQ